MVRTLYGVHKAWETSGRTRHVDRQRFSPIELDQAYLDGLDRRDKAKARLKTSPRFKPTLPKLKFMEPLND